MEKDKQECVQWETAGAALPCRVGGCLCSSLEQVAGLGPWPRLGASTRGETARAGPKWVCDAPAPGTSCLLGAAGLHRQTDLAVMEVFMLFQLAVLHSFHIQMY